MRRRIDSSTARRDRTQSDVFKVAGTRQDVTVTLTVHGPRHALSSRPETAHGSVPATLREQSLNTHKLSQGRKECARLLSPDGQPNLDYASPRFSSALSGARGVVPSRRTATGIR